MASKPVVIQVAAPKWPLQEQVRELMLIFALGLPVAVAVAGLGGTRWRVARWVPWRR